MIYVILPLQEATQKILNLSTSPDLSTCRTNKDITKALVEIKREFIEAALTSIPYRFYSEPEIKEIFKTSEWT